MSRGFRGIFAFKLVIVRRHLSALLKIDRCKPFPTLNAILQAPKSQLLASLFSAILRCFSVRHSIHTLKNRKKQFCLLNGRMLDLVVKNQSVRIGCQMCRVRLFAFSPVSAYSKMSAQGEYIHSGQVPIIHANASF